jgi:hypothetical protein
LLKQKLCSSQFDALSGQVHRTFAAKHRDDQPHSVIANPLNDAGLPGEDAIIDPATVANLGDVSSDDF